MLFWNTSNEKRYLQRIVNIALIISILNPVATTGSMPKLIDGSCRMSDNLEGKTSETAREVYT